MEDIITTRDKIVRSIFENNLDDIKNDYEKVKENGVDPKNLCTTITWNDKELEGKTEEEIKYIKNIRDFIQKLFSEYQIRSTSILANKTNEYQDKEFKDESARNLSLMNDLQNDASNLLIEMFIKCINWCNKQEHDNAFNYYKKDLEQIENLYIDIKKKNKILENENTDLKQQIENMKKKKFLGIFKVFK